MNSSRDPAAGLLLRMAERDFAAASKMAADTDFADETFGFHAQQAVEKASKAMLAARGIAFERTHNLEPLIDQLVDSGVIDEGKFEDLLGLTDFAVFYRYQPFDELDAHLDRGATIQLVQQFIARAVQVVR